MLNATEPDNKATERTLLCGFSLFVHRLRNLNLYNVEIYFSVCLLHAPFYEFLSRHLLVLI